MSTRFGYSRNNNGPGAFALGARSGDNKDSGQRSDSYFRGGIEE